MQTNNRNKIKEANEQQLHERLRVLTSSNTSDKNPIDDMIEHRTATENSETLQNETVE